MPLEIERKFLINKEIWKSFHKPAGIFYKQGYLHTQPGLTIRLRVVEDKAYLTFKGKTRGISRLEYEYEIPKPEVIELMENFAGSCIEKTRYIVDFKNSVFEVDEFHGDNDGLIIAEIELKSETEEFERPPWLAEEVTGIEKYYNSYIAQHPYKTWKTV